MNLLELKIFWEGHKNFKKSLLFRKSGRFFQILWPSHNILILTFRSKSSSDKRKTTTYTWESNYRVAIFQKRIGKYTVLAKLSLCKVAKLLIEFTLQQGCFTLFYLQMCCIPLRRYYYISSILIIESHPLYP